MAPARDRMFNAFVLVLFAALAGAGKTYYGLLRPAWDVMRARSWISAPMEQWRARIIPFHGVRHGDFEYQYVFNGTRYPGTRYAFVHPSTFLNDDDFFRLQDSDSLLPTCYVNPKHPTEAVITRALPWKAYRYSGLGVLAVSALMMFAIWRLAPRERRRNRHWVLTGVRGLAIVWLGLIGALVFLNSANPFTLFDIGTNEIHDPGYFFENVLGGSASSCWMLLGAPYSATRAGFTQAAAAAGGGS